MFMVNYNKLLKKLEEKGINSYVIRKKGLIPQSTLTKFKMCSGTPEEIKKKLEDYKNDPKHNGKEFKRLRTYVSCFNVSHRILWIGKWN